MNTPEQRRVVVTGIGLVTPLGTGVEKNWDALIAGRSGIRRISRFSNLEAYPSQIAGEVPDFSPADFIEPKEIKKMDLFIQYAVAAAVMAMTDSGLKIDTELAEQVGVIIGVGLCGIDTIETTKEAILQGGPRKISPFFIPKVISNLGSRSDRDPSWCQGNQFNTHVCMRVRYTCHWRGLSLDPARFTGCGDYRGC